MKRAVMLLVLCLVGAGLAACAVHGGAPFGEESTTVASHGLGCGATLLVGGLATALSFLPLTGSLVSTAGPGRLLGRPVSFFQPPERFA